MGLIRRTRLFRQDYLDIWNYIADRNPAAASDLLRDFESKLQLLSRFPGAGPARPELRPGLPSFPVGDYLLFYRPIRGGVELIRVLHGARDLRKALRRG
jgi:toxin ParE1/3/4